MSMCTQPPDYLNAKSVRQILQCGERTLATDSRHPSPEKDDDRPRWAFTAGGVQDIHLVRIETGGSRMNVSKYGGPLQTATDVPQKPRQYNRIDDLHNIRASEYNQIKTELQLLRIDFERIYNGCIQLGTAHAELLLDQQQVWREYLLDNVYVGTLHPEVRDDVLTFLEMVSLQSRLKGAVG